MTKEVRFEKVADLLEPESPYDSCPVYTLQKQGRNAFCVILQRRAATKHGKRLGFRVHKSVRQRAL